MKDYTNNPECRGIEPEVFWVVGYDGVPLRAQGFLGAWKGRDDDHWFPEPGFTTRKPFMWDTLAEAAAEARRRLDAKRAKLDSVAEQIRAVEHGEVVV